MSGCRLWLAARMVDKLAAAVAGRSVHVVADAAYAGEELKSPASIGDLDHPAVQGRRPVHLAPPRSGKRGRLRKKGDRLGSLAQLAATATPLP